MCKKCFPATSLVNLQDGKSVPMSHVQVGDMVQTGKVIFFTKPILILPYITFSRFHWVFKCLFQ